MKHLGKTTSIIAALVLLTAAVLAALEFTNTTHLFHESAEDSGINYGPPDEASIKDSESRKTEAPSPSDNTNDSQGTAGSTDSSKKTVTPIISTWAQRDSTLDVNSFVQGIVEDGGTCTLTLVAKSDGTKVSQSRSAVSNASNTSCGVISVPLSKLSTGTWTATVSYSSSTSVGTSDKNDLEVQ